MNSTAAAAVSVTVAPGHHAARCFLVRDEYIWVVAATTRPLGEGPATIDVLEAE